MEVMERRLSHLQGMEQKLSHLEKHIQNNPSQSQESKVRPTRKVKKKKKKSKYKDTSSSDSDSSSDSSSTSLECNFVPKSSVTPISPEKEWHKYLDRKKLLFLCSPHYISAWVSEGRPKLKMKIKTMAELQTKHSSSLKQLKENSKEFNDRINTISRGSMDTFSINNIAQRTRIFLIRFGVNTKLFNHILVEFCLNSTLKNLALSNPSIMEDTEQNLLNWLSQRNLNSSSEQRLKKDIKNYLKQAIKSKQNMSTVISNLQGIFIPELLQARLHTYVSSSPESREQQDQREARSFQLDSLEEHAPICFA